MKWSSFLTGAPFSQFSIPTDCKNTLLRSLCKPIITGSLKASNERVPFQKAPNWEATLWVKACWRCCASFWGVWSGCFASSCPAALYQSWLHREHSCTAKSNPWIIMDYSFIWVSCRSCRVVEQREYLTEVEETSQGLSSFLSFCVPHARKRGGDNSW